MFARRTNFRIISLISAVVCLFTFVFTQSLNKIDAAGNAQVFTDVPNSHWAFNYVNNLSELGIVKGLDDGTFGVDLTATRAEFATFMVRTLKVDTNITYGNVFKDVSEGQWYALNVEAAYNAKIIKGTGDGNFQPDANITRQEVTTVLSNAIAVSKNCTVAELAKGCVLSNPDADLVSDWAVNGLKVCYKYGLINGYEDGSFIPEAYITRAEVAKVISIFNDFLNSLTPTLTPVPTDTVTPTPTLVPTDTITPTPTPTSTTTSTTTSTVVPTPTPTPTPTPVPALTPEPPRVFLDSTYIEPVGNIISVHQGDNLQTAINSAKPGDTIEVQAGAKFYGNFVLPNKSGEGWIYIRSSSYSSLPAPESRVSPADAANMPMIITPNSDAVFRTENYAHNYRLIGLEVTSYDGTEGTECYDLIQLGDAGQTTLDVVAHDLVVDRCYMHGCTDLNLKRAVALNSASSSIIDSYISDCHTDYPDGQGIQGYNGPGPFKIVNNYIEGGSENIMFGGADTHIPDLTPCDIEVRGNYLFKPLTWKQDDPSFGGIAWNVKNIFELKHANRVLVEGNVMENCWIAADQLSYAIVLTPRNQNGGSPWVSLKDILITNNIVRNSNRAIMVMGRDDGQISQLSERIEISNNLFYNIDPKGIGQAINLTKGGTDIIFDHNDIFSTSAFMFVYNAVAHFQFTNNITLWKSYGFSSMSLDGDRLIDNYFSDGIFTKNIMAGGKQTTLKKYLGNYFNPPATVDDIGFVNYASGDYHLAGTSLYKNAGTDGRDIGTDINALNTATAKTILGK